jgi:hypothetical protein
MIAHDGSLVHPDGKSSTAPDPTRLENLLQQASTARNPKGDLKGGLDLGEERLPDGWWYSRRPKETVGLLRARKTANEVAKLSKQIAEEAGI